jgi:hypothetical protein
VRFPRAERPALDLGQVAEPAVEFDDKVADHRFGRWRFEGLAEYFGPRAMHGAGQETGFPHGDGHDNGRFR